MSRTCSAVPPRANQPACDSLFDRYRDRLKRMIHVRLSRRLQGRVDDSDVLQEAYLEKRD